METTVSSASFAEPLAGWLGERMPLRVFGPAAAGMLLASALAGNPSFTWLAGALPALALLLLQFRLWDDLADVERDRVEHPQRLLPRCPSLTPFRVALVATAVAAALAVALHSGPAAALGVVALDAAAIAWYRRPYRRRAGILGALVVLAKYPLFVAVIAPASADALSLAAACVAVYLAFCIHEWRTA
jgi:4-hydroxybenzoate polyprenyltransferase